MTLVVQVRNGWFSFRWSQIFEAGSIVSSHTVVQPPPLPLPILFSVQLQPLQIKARRASPSDPLCPFAPPPIAEVAAAIAANKPDGAATTHVLSLVDENLIFPRFFWCQLYLRRMWRQVRE